MTLDLGYNANVPFGPNDPADDQPQMLQNTQSINTWTDVDHIGYNTAGSGLHKKVTMFASFAPPNFPNGGSGVLYGFLVGANTMPWWQVSSLATFPLVSGVPSVLANGYTYLAGLGLKLAWGTITGAPIAPNAPVTFPVGLFTNVFSVTLGGQTNSTNDKTINIKTGTLTIAGFLVSTSNTSSFQSLSWMAIGN